IADERKLVQAPLGHAREFTAEPKPDAIAAQILGALRGKPYLMHVGSCIPRKRVDFLLRLVADVRIRLPEVQLLKVGGTWTAEQRSLIGELHLQDALVHAQGIERQTLAA